MLARNKNSRLIGVFFLVFFGLLASFTWLLLFSPRDYSTLASAETVENNHNPSSECTGSAYINIDGNLACFLCPQCFREFYCSPVSLLRQYLWVGRPVCSMDKEQQLGRLCSPTRRGVPHADTRPVCVSSCVRVGKASTNSEKECGQRACVLIIKICF